MIQKDLSLFANSLSFSEMSFKKIVFKFLEF